MRRITGGCAASPRAFHGIRFPPADSSSFQRLGGPNSKASYRTAKRCPKCGGRMKVVAFLTEVAVVDRIIDHLELTFVADRPQPCSPHGFLEGRLRVFLSRSPCRRPLRPVLKETSLRLHECGRGERGIFLGFDDQEGAGVYHLSAGARGFSVQICFSGSIFAFFGVIDIAERPEVYYPCGQAGRFIGRSRNLSNSSCTGKSKFLSFQVSYSSSAQPPNASFPALEKAAEDLTNRPGGRPF